MLNSRIYQGLLVFILNLSIVLVAPANQEQRIDLNICKLLLDMETYPTRDRSLTTLFQVGDEHIQDLIQALDNPNEIIQRNAQIVIRYLGNETGMRSLIKSYMKSTVVSQSGPVPLPLLEWDYEYIKKFYLTHNNGWDVRATSYIFALALDGSPKANTYLRELCKKSEKRVIPFHHALGKIKSLQSHKPLMGETDLGKLVTANAFFIDSDSLQYTSSKILGFNQAKDKVLIETYVNRDILATELFHVVLKKHEKFWEFYSVTLVAVS